MGKQTKSHDAEHAKILVVFGIDPSGKPRAARFVGANAKLVAKAAQAMELKVAEAATEAQAEIAKKLATGRLYSTGRGFVPYLRRDLYTKLLAALGVEGGESGGPADARAAYVYPATYDEIAPGHLVLVQESLQYGWWESIVVARNGDMVTVRWRDYKAPEFVRHLDAVALIRPPAPPAPQADASPQ